MSWTLPPLALAWLFVGATAAPRRDPHAISAQAPSEVPAVDRFEAWAKSLHAAAFVHARFEGVLVSPDAKDPTRSQRWTFQGEVWMAKGGKVQARTTWAGPKPREGDAETFTSLCFADGKQLWQGFEGATEWKPTTLPSPRFVPHPLPEIFGLFDGALSKDLPVALPSSDFDWGEKEAPRPTVMVVDPTEPALAPAHWYGLGEKALNSWCTMQPESEGGDVLRGRFTLLDFPAKLPDVDPPRFSPKQD